jgi:heptosyltransferase II
MRVGVFLPNWVGDVVMATPALRAMRKLVGNSGQLVGVMRPYVAEVLAGTPWLDQQIVYDKPASRLAFATREVYGQLRAARLDRMILLTNSVRTAWMAWRSGARERIGYRGEGRAWLLNKRLSTPHAIDGGAVPTIDGYLLLARAAGCDPDSPRLELGTMMADEQAADAIWRQFGLPPGHQVIVLNSGGAFGAAKRWPPEYFAELARRLVAGGKYSVLVNCGPAEREIAREISVQADDPRIVSLDTIEALPVGQTKACIRRSRMLVTTDSGPRYFGIAFGRPVVTLFGPTDPRRTQSYYARENCLSLALDCQPCMARTCPLVHHRCMRDLSVDIVHNAVVRGLEESAAESAA